MNARSLDSYSVSSVAELAAPPRAPARLRQFLLGRVLAWLGKRAVLEELRRLDERTLADLRISPADFDAIASGIHRRDPAALRFDTGLEPLNLAFPAAAKLATAATAAASGKTSPARKPYY